MDDKRTDLDIADLCISWMQNKMNKIKQFFKSLFEGTPQESDLRIDYIEKRMNARMKIHNTMLNEYIKRFNELELRIITLEGSHNGSGKKASGTARAD